MIYGQGGHTRGIDHDVKIFGVLEFSAPFPTIVDV